MPMLDVCDAVDLPCKPKIDSDRDGVVQQWFATEADFRASHGRADSPTRTDTFAHVSRFESP